jgi:hypothetical protein
MLTQVLLDLVPQVLRHDRLVLAFVDLALVGDPADVDRVRQNLVDVAAADRTAAGRVSQQSLWYYPLRELLAGENSTPAPRAVGALWNPHPLEIITNTGQISLPSEAAFGELG